MLSPHWKGLEMSPEGDASFYPGQSGKQKQKNLPRTAKSFFMLCGSSDPDIYATSVNPVLIFYVI